MIKRKVLKNVLILMFVFIGIAAFLVINETKAEASGWKWIDNSWRYYNGPEITTGWVEDNGNWYYLDEEGLLKAGWIKDGGKWYYLDESSGKMLTGWIENQGKWYYLNSTGEMRIGWYEENGNLYYFNNSGEMVRDAYIGSYYLGPSGVCQRDHFNKRK